MRFVLPFLLLTGGVHALPSAENYARMRRAEAAPPRSDKVKPSSKCGGSEWLLTAANWKAAEVDKSFKAWYDAWAETAKQGDSMMEAFGDKFLSRSGGMRCDIDNWCVIPPCTSVVEDGQGKPVKWAFLAAHGMASLNNWMKIQSDAWQVAQNTQNSNSLFMVQQFTDATDQFPPPKHGLDILFQLLTFGLMGISVVIPEAAPIVTAIASVVGVSQMFVPGAGGGGGSKPPSSAERQLDKAASVGVWISDTISGISKTLSDLNVALLAGNKLGDATIVEVLAGGSFMFWDAGQGDRLKQYYKTLLTAKVINQLWTRDRHYIARVDAPNGNCASDTRWPKPELRYCDPADPAHSYWYKGYSEPQRKFSNPKGQDLLPGLGIQFQDLMRSSVDAFKMMGSNNTYAWQGNPELASQVFQAKAPQTNQTSGMFQLPTGTFLIPICAGKDTRIIGKYDDDGGDAGYPCTCGINDATWPTKQRIFKGDFPHGDKQDTRMFWYLSGWDQGGSQGPKKGGGYNDLFNHCQDLKDPFIHMYDDIKQLDLMPAWPDAPAQKPGINPHWGIVWRTDCKGPGPNGGWIDC